MMRPTFSSNMKSGSGMATAMADSKALVASWLPLSAPKRAAPRAEGLDCSEVTGELVHEWHPFVARCLVSRQSVFERIGA
jgi:hypothetical protein